MARNEIPQMITLVGPKHVGKTSVGKALARMTGATFIDLDEVIEKKAGCSPRALFEQGPEIFRAAEAEAAALIVTEARENAPIVLASGGGIVDNPAAFDALRGRSVLVYLELDASRAWERIRAAAERSGSLPPFLRGDDPQSIHRNLHERRAAAYRAAADLIVNAAEGGPAKTAAAVLEKVRAMGLAARKL